MLFQKSEGRYLCSVNFKTIGYESIDTYFLLSGIGVRFITLSQQIRSLSKKWILCCLKETAIAFNLQRVVKDSCLLRKGH